ASISGARGKPRATRFALALGFYISRRWRSSRDREHRGCTEKRYTSSPRGLKTKLDSKLRIRKDTIQPTRIHEVEISSQLNGQLRLNVEVQTRADIKPALRGTEVGYVHARSSLHIASPN